MSAGPAACAPAPRARTPEGGARNPGAVLGASALWEGSGGCSRSQGLSGEVSALPLPALPLQRGLAHTRGLGHRPTPRPLHPDGLGRAAPGLRQWSRLPRGQGGGCGTRASFTACSTGTPTPGPEHVAEDGAAPPGECSVLAGTSQSPVVAGRTRSARSAVRAGEAGGGMCRWRPRPPRAGHGGGGGGGMACQRVCPPGWGRAGRRVCLALAFLPEPGSLHTRCGGAFGETWSVLRALETEPGREASLYL